jgi:hypothetical protein
MQVDFNRAQSISYRLLDIQKAMFRSVQLWPTKKDVTATIDLRRQEFYTMVRNAEAGIDYPYDATYLRFSIPHDTTVLSVWSKATAETDSLFVYGNMWISRSMDSMSMYGHNRSQDPNSEGQEPVPGKGRGMQSRYGGTWILPGDLTAGDKLFLNLGSDSAATTFAVITLT